MAAKLQVEIVTDQVMVDRAENRKSQNQYATRFDT